MIAYRVINALLTICTLAVFINGIKFIRHKEAIIQYQAFLGERKKKHLVGKRAVVLGWQYVILGGVFTVAGAIGTVADVDFIGIPINFFGGILCFLPFALALLIVGIVVDVQEKAKDKPKNW